MASISVGARASRALSARSLAALLTDWRAASADPAYVALADRVSLLILDGRISYGTRMPAERELATHLGLSRTTVTAAYARLREAGYLDSLRGSGSSARIPQSGTIPAETAVAGYLDFTKATSPASSGLAAAAERAAADYPAYLGGSGFDLLGLPVLRAAIAERFAVRGLPTDPDQIMVTVGAQHAIALLARVYLGRGTRAVVESPSYPHAVEALRLNGARLSTVAVTTAPVGSSAGTGTSGTGAAGARTASTDAAGATTPPATLTDEGWDLEALENALGGGPGAPRDRPALAYLMPDFHNPTGRSMSEALRARVMELAAASDCVVVADETTAELALDDQPLPAPLAAFGPAITVGSLAKTVWGGVRIGWIRADRETIQRLVRARPASDLGTPILDQLLAAHVLAEFDLVLTQRREQLRAGRDRLLAALRERFPTWHVPDVAGGLTAWVNLGAPVSSALALAAREHGLLVAPGPRFGVDGAFERSLRLPFSYSADETDRAVDALAAAWGSLARIPVADQGYLAEVV